MKSSKSVNLKNFKFKDNVALENRPFRFKKAAMEFFCPLCRSERAITTGPRLTQVNYIQISLLTFVTSFSLWSLMEWRSLFCVFIYWGAFEGTRRMLFRKEVQCPYCGFDAGWYKKDVKVARRLVDEFWQLRSSSEIDPNHSNDSMQESASL